MKPHSQILVLEHHTRILVLEPHSQIFDHKLLEDYVTGNLEDQAWHEGFLSCINMALKKGFDLSKTRLNLYKIKTNSKLRLLKKEKITVYQKRA